MRHLVIGYDEEKDLQLLLKILKNFIGTDDVIKMIDTNPHKYAETETSISLRVDK